MEKQPEGYEEIRDRREGKYGRMIFYGFLICVAIGIIVVVSFGITEKFRILN